MKYFRLLMVLTASLLLVWTFEPSASVQEQIDSTRVLQVKQVDYAERERRAPEQIKARLATLRRENQSRNRRYTLGYTTALDVPLEVLAGTRIPKDLPIERVNQRATDLKRVDVESARVSKIRPYQLAPCSAGATSWDWRRRGKVTPVKAQICGTCWDFTAMGAYEGSYAIRNNQLIDTSEQYILRCAGAGGCAGGWWMPVFDFMISNGTTTEAALPFTGVEGSCPTGLPLPYRAVAWGFVAPGGTTSTIPTIAQTKQALCDHGPLAVALMADGQFQAYTGGVFDETDKTFDWINHGVTLIGWDNNRGAWLIKNSWGPGWGSTADFGTEKGYMWIAYGSNNIGIASAWVDAKNNRYHILKDWFKVLEREQIIVKPFPDPDPGPIIVRPRPN